MFNLVPGTYPGALGFDDDEQSVYATLFISLESSRNYDAGMDCINMLDIIKQSSSGFLDKLEVYSSLRIYGAEPQPTSRTDRSVVWENRDAASAPLWYRVYLSSFTRVKVRVEGLAGYRFSIEAGGRIVAELSAGEEKELTFR